MELAVTSACMPGLRSVERARFPSIEICVSWVILYVVLVLEYSILIVLPATDSIFAPEAFTFSGTGVGLCFGILPLAKVTSGERTKKVRMATMATKRDGFMGVNLS